jgi:hypothetical protein
VCSSDLPDVLSGEHKKHHCEDNQKTVTAMGNKFVDTATSLLWPITMMPPERARRTSQTFIHRSAWKRSSAKFGGEKEGHGP